MIDEGNTIPFISRYRKEVTGALNDEVLRNLNDRLTYLRNLEEKKTQVLSSIEEQGKLTEELKKQILEAQTLVVVEDLYRPYRPKRRTRATIAKEKGLEPLANIILLQMTDKSLEEEAKAFVSEEKEVATVEAAISGAKDIVAEEVETFETVSVKEGIEKWPELPRVGYVLMLQSQGLMHDTYVYGVDAKQSLSTIIMPTEIMDGAIVSGNCVSACDKNTTYHHLNNPVIRDLFAQHGKTLNFVGVIITNENVYLADKMRSSDWSSKLCEWLGLDGAIVSQEGFGNPDTDLIMNCKKIEGKGVKTVIITDEYAGRDGASQSLADADAAANAVVTGGNANEVIHLPKMDKVIGYPEVADIIAGGFDGSLQADGSIIAELQVITGATNEMGFNKLSAR